ncbi:MAG: carbohydrate-binding domain-containing protein [Bacteroidales bacterium]|nr:carbohydrate-binding domain-containing protein [Bacteroidales bacterium]
MKKIIAILAFVVAVLSLSAQNKLLYYSGGNVIYTKTIENVDSVSFLPTGTSTAYTNISSETPFSFPVMGIDSIVLYIASLDGEEPQQQDDGDWIYINYTNGGAVGVVNPWSSRGITVTCNGEDVVVNALSGTENRTIVVAGTTADGSLTISSDNKFDLRLNGANITNPTGAAINVLSDVRVKLVLEDGTTNSLADGSTSEFKAAFLCEGSIEVYGNGTLNVAGNKQHGINSDAHINIYTGTINVTSAVKDGIHANNFRLYGGNVTVSGFGGDGIEAEYGSVEHADQGTIKLMGGSLNMTVANADCKGLKCDTLTIQGGTHNLTASGAQTKAVKSTMVYIAGGNTTITASGAAVVTAGDPSYCTGIKATEMYVTNGELTITCPSSNDGARAISTDNLFSMNGGTVTLSVAGNGGSYTNTSNVADTYSATCIKSDATVEIYSGTLDLTCSGTDSKGISCDNVVNLNGGNYTLKATGTDSKAVKADVTLNVNNGTYTVTCSGQDCKGFSCDGTINVVGGDITLTMSGKAAKGFKSDVAFVMNDGTITANISGATLVSGTDASNSVAVKSSGTLTINGGTINATATSASGGAKGLSSVGNMTINGGNITITTAGAGATLSGSGTSCTDGYAPCCIKSEGNLTILAGVINCSSTGKGGKGIACDGILTIGTANADNNLIDIDVMTSGAAVNASSSGGGGGFPGGGGSSSSDYWKGLPKGIKSVGNIVINSGHVSSYCAQTSGDPTGEAIESKDGIYINGGFVEANSYDDAINCSNHFEMNGGYVWAYARGNDGIDCNGAYTYFNGGIVIVAGTEEAIDANSDGMGGTQGHLIINGSTIIAYRASSGGMGGGGGMALLDSPTYQNGQKYLSPTFSAGSKYCIKNSSGTAVLIYQHPSSITGSGFMTNSGIRPPGGGGSSSSYVFTSPNVTSGTYTMYTNPTISGTANWHGIYVGASATTSGSGTSLSAQ